MLWLLLFIYNIEDRMTLATSKIIILFLLTLLASLHYATAFIGRTWISSKPYTTLIHYELQKYSPLFIYILAAASIQILLFLASIIQLCTHYQSSKLKYVLAELQLINTFILAVVLAINASQVTAQRDFMILLDPSKLHNEDPAFYLYFIIVIIDSSVTFTFQFLYSALMYFTALKEYEEDLTNQDIIKRRVSKKNRRSKY